MAYKVGICCYSKKVFELTSWK